MTLLRWKLALVSPALTGMLFMGKPAVSAATPKRLPYADLAKIEKAMPPLKHDRGHRWPITFWGHAPQREAAMKVWVERGVIPQSNPAWDNYPAMPFLHYLQDHDVPIIVMNNWIVRNAFRKSGHPRSPAWLYENPKLSDAADYARAFAQSLKDEGITPASIWIDFENGAYLRNRHDKEEDVRKQMKTALDSPIDVKRFGKDRLEAIREYQSIVNKARAHAIRTAFSDPIHSVFPGLLVGNFYTWPIARSIKQNPARYAGRYPAYGWENSGMSVAQPRAYFGGDFLGDAQTSQKEIDWNIFHEALDRFSRAARVLKPDEMLVPWVGYLLTGKFGHWAEKQAEAGGRIASAAAYQEMVIQTMMRGAETFAVYVPQFGTQFSDAYPKDFPRRELGPMLLNLVDVQRGYDTMLRFNDLLRKGKVLNYDVPDREHPGPVWSGVATNEEALIRTVTFGSDTEQTIRVFDQSIKLPFEKQGRFFKIDPDGRISPLAASN